MKLAKNIKNGFLSNDFFKFNVYWILMLHTFFKISYSFLSNLSLLKNSTIENFEQENVVYPLNMHQGLFTVHNRQYWSNWQYWCK